MKKKKDDETYRLTFKGLILVATGFKERATQDILDAVELYLRRNHMKEPGEAGAIIYTGKEWVMTSVQLKEGE